MSDVPVIFLLGDISAMNPGLRSSRGMQIEYECNSDAGLSPESIFFVKGCCLMAWK